MADFVPRFRAWVDEFVHRLQPSSLGVSSLLEGNGENGAGGWNGHADLLEKGSASLYASALEAAEDGVVLARRAGESDDGSPLRVEYVNEAFERITGFGSADMEERGLEVLVGDHTDPSALRRFHRAVRNRERSKMELAIDRRDGSRCWIEMTAAPVEDGMPYVVMIVRDVTKRKERERHERVEREVLEHVSEGGSVEKGLDRLLGLLEETESAKAAILLMEEGSGTLRHLAAPDLPEPFVEQIEAIDGATTVATCGTAYLQNEGVVVPDIEEDERWKDHRHVAARWGIEACWANPIRSSDGEVMGVLAVYHTESRAPSPDEWNAVRKVAHLASIIVEWKRAEVALEESEHLFRTLAEESHLGIYLIQDGELQYVNPRFCEITGYPYRELMTRRSLEEVVHPDDWAGFRDDIRRCAEGEEGEDVHREYRIETSEGEERHVELFGTSVAYLGKSAVFGTVVDVTERKDEQEALINAKEEAEEMHQLKSAFLANMSHEIRTPLTSILGFSEILADEVPEEGEEFVGLIQQSGERLYQTLNSVLDLSELEAGAIHVSDEPIDVADRLATTVDLLLPQAVQKDVDLNVETPYGGVEARVDGASFDRIVTNLVHNAIKFTEEGRVTVRLEEGDERFRVYVEDTGVGMSEDFLSELFEAFRQESSGLTRSHEGAGLGLTITHRLVQLLGGTIDVESTKGQGTTFTVELPKEPSDE